jgi:hypothetical protein
MYPPIFQAVNVAGVQALLKTATGPLRFYLFGMAPQNTPLPYAVWQTAYGAPENYLNEAPDVDSFGGQIDVYASPSQGPATARAVAEAIRDAIEPHCHITSWRGDSTDPVTKNARFSFDFEWFVNR